VLQNLYGRALDKVKIQADLHSAKQLDVMSVSQLVMEIEKFAARLHVDVETLIFNFIMGLKEELSTPLQATQFTSFNDAVTQAKVVESRLNMRKSAIAVSLPQARPVFSPPIPSAQLTIDTSFEANEAYPVEGMNAIQGLRTWRGAGRGSRGAFRGFRGRRFNPYQYQGQPRGAHHQSSFSGVARRSQPSGDQCGFCGLDNHSTSVCHLRERINKQRSRNGLPVIMMLVNESSLLGPRLTALVTIGKKRVLALIDTGATASFVKTEIIPSQTHLKPSRQIFLGGNMLPIAHRGRASLTLSLHDELDPTSCEFFVVDQLPFQAVLGSDLLSALDVWVGVKATQLLLPGGRTVQLSNTRPSPQQDQSALVIVDEAISYHNNIVDDLARDVSPSSSPRVIREMQSLVSHDLPPVHRNMVLSILARYQELFSQAVGTKPCNFTPFKIDTGDSLPVAAPLQRVPYTHREATTKVIKEYLHRG